MRVSTAYLEPNLEFNIHLDEDDRINPSEKYSLNQKKFSFTLPWRKRKSWNDCSYFTY